MRILDPVLAPDVSDWCNRINSKEFEDGGCESIVIGLYPTTVNGVWVLHPTCRAQLAETATHSHLVIQGYYWDDPTLDPLMQAYWVRDTIAKEGFPIKWVWIDDEQWWSSWSLWSQAVSHQIPWSSVPHFNAYNLSLHMQLFAQSFHSLYPNSGVYTNNGFVSSWAPGMNAWLPLYRSWVAEYGREPSVVTKMTWAQLKANWMPNYDLILAAGQLPDKVMGHQFEGDLIELPGAYDQNGNEQVLDLNVFSEAFITELRGGPVPVPAPLPVPVPTPSPTDVYTVVKWTWVFAAANDGAGCKLLGSLTVGMSVTVAAIVGDWARLTQPVAGWVRLATLKKK